MNNQTLLNRLTAALVFLYALVLYGSTVAPTASFWDCGEFIAISNRLEVSHPPGAPFFMLLGRVFSMFVPTQFVSLSINLMSVVASAVTVLMTYLITVHLVEEWRGDSATWSRRDQIGVYGGSAIGALTFAATDSFWFNAVEAEVYALSMFFTAIVVWLIMKWSAHIRHERASGTIQGRFGFGPVTSRYLVIIAYLFGLAIGIHLLNVLSIFFVALIVFFDMFDRPDWSSGQRFKGLILTGIIASLCFFAIYPGVILWLPELADTLGSITVTVVGLTLVVAALIYYTQKNRMPLANLAAISFAVILIGYSTYGLIFIRSAADPPIDENDPETLDSIVSYLKREQYGTAPLFPRMHSPMPSHKAFYARYPSEFSFFEDYQLNHMYIRYFLWNFVGRQSDEQDAGWTAGFTAPQDTLALSSPSGRASRNVYFALPLLLGLFGMMYHFMRDWRRAMAVGLLFLLTGVGVIVYLNQTPMQPRERDYSYVGSFFAFSIWMGVGATGILELAADGLKRIWGKARRFQTAGTAAALVVLLFVPFWVAYENYDDHDRSGRYVATDYAYNLLMSLEPNAIVFTNGDNDTFPLWYMQEVESVRRDVRVVCLSLLNTKWYIRQLRDEWSRESAPIPMSYSDNQIEQLTVVPWQPQEIRLPVRLQAVMTQENPAVTPDDSALVQSPMVWRFEGRPYSDKFNMLYVADQAALDIIIENAKRDWKRPVYFANTTSRDGQLDLQRYFQAEGLAYRVVPIPQEAGYQGRVIPELAYERFKRFRFRGLNDPGVHFDENIRRMIDNYRLTFAHMAQEMASAGHKDEARDMLVTLMEKVPFNTIPGDVFSTISLANAFEAVDAPEWVTKALEAARPLVLQRVATAANDRDLRQLQQFIQMIQVSYFRNGDFARAADFTRQIAEVAGDTSIAQTEQELRQRYGSLVRQPDASSIGDTLADSE